MKVFIASSANNNIPRDYKEIASKVATILARKDYKLLFGACDQGMMGETLLTYKYEGKKVKGFADITDAETANGLELDALDVFPTTFDRTKALYEAADLIVILPGGVGTLSELFSILEENNTRKDNKKIVIFNYNHFYTSLLNYLTRLYESGFITKDLLKTFVIVRDIDNFKTYIDNL